MTIHDHDVVDIASDCFLNSPIIMSVPTGGIL